MLLYLPVPQPSRLSQHHREHRNSKQGMKIHMDSNKTKSQFTALISWQYIQSVIGDYEPLCHWNELTEAQAKMPKNPTFCTRFWTASLAREAKSCKEENKALMRQNPKWTYLKTYVISTSSMLWGFLISIWENFSNKKANLKLWA